MTSAINKYLLSVSLATALMGRSASATSIVCIRSPESIVIAADSMLTVRNGDKSDTVKAECKIRHAGSFFFTLSGFYKDPARGFDVIRIITDSLDSEIPLVDGAKVVTARVTVDLLVELNRLKSESPDAFSIMKKKGGALTSVLLTGFEKGTAEAILLKFRPAVSATGETVITVERNSCPGDCNPGNIQAFYLTDMKAINEHLKQGNKIDWRTPEAAAKLLVDLVIDAHTPGVAPPVDVLRIDRNGPLWVVRKPECPEITGSPFMFADP